jgi:predicted MPP superfamily phosphohydrolase
MILSFMLWFLLIKITVFKGFYDEPGNIATRMNLMGFMCAVVFPRILLSFLHFSGRLLRFRKGGHSMWLTRTGILLSSGIFVIVALGSFAGRFNFKTEMVTVRIKGLDPKISGLRIVLLSDMHLASFYHHRNLLVDLMDEVKSYNPDLIINTGDFVSFGWREFDRCDTILLKAISRYGNFAVSGNHDMGTYLPNSSDAEKEANTIKMNDLITASGYRMLNDENIILNIRGVIIAFIGVTTSGRHPDIIHGDLHKAMEGIDSVDLKILLAHDPNQWEQDVTGKTDINLTLSGHTHGMQMGIMTKRYKWSPSLYFYPKWNGLYKEGDQYLYVNRGLGVLAIPFRIWMPPEITILTLETVKTTGDS